MRKLLVLFIILLNIGFVYHSQAKVTLPMLSGSTAAGSAPVDYTADANCMGAWYMNATGNETDRSGEGGTLNEAVGQINLLPNECTDVDAPHGDCTGSGTASGHLPSGYSGTSRYLESGDTEYLNLAEPNSADITGNLTLAIWIKPQDDTAADMYIIGKWQSASGKRQYQLKYDDADTCFECIMSSDGEALSAKAQGATDISYGAWQHIACVYNGTDIRIYVNGSLDSNGASNPLTYSSGIFNGSAPFVIGREANSTLWYDGLVDEAIVFNRALSAAEINDIYTNGISANKGGND